MILPEEIDESLNVPWKDHGQGHQSVEQQGRSWKYALKEDDLQYSRKVGSNFSKTWTNTRRAQRPNPKKNIVYGTLCPSWL